MAILHKAQLDPTKPQMLARFVPTQPWGAGAGAFEVLGAFRFDDPDGEVGVETHLLRGADGRVLQVPTTYRPAPLAGAEHAFITTMEHSVLGPRWVYDGAGDPVYVATLAATMITGGTEAPMQVDQGDGTLVDRPLVVRVAGSGTPGEVVPAIVGVTNESDAASTVLSAGGLDIVLVRVIDAVDAAGGVTLTGTWPGRDEPAVLAYLR